MCFGGWYSGGFRAPRGRSLQFDSAVVPFQALVVVVVGILGWLWSPGSPPRVALRVRRFLLAGWSMGFVWTLWRGAHDGRVGFQVTGHGEPFLTADHRIRFVLGAPEGSGRRASRGFA